MTIFEIKEHEFCAYCGRLFDYGVMSEQVGGWYVCQAHRMMVRENRYNAKCRDCSDRIDPGEDVCMVPPGEQTTKWTIFHLRRCCLSDHPSKMHLALEEKNRRESQKEKTEQQRREYNNPLSSLFLTPNAPDDLVKNTYKFLALKYHPDRGGSEEKMKSLNQAMDFYQSKKGGR